MSTRFLKRAVRRVLPDAIVHAIAMARADEPLIPVISGHARGGTFIDIGANIGVYSHALRGIATRIVAFEPVPVLAAALRRRYPDIEVHACALSARAGSAILHVPSRAQEQVFPRASLNDDANPGFSLEGVPVQMRTLDEFGIRDARVIKIDVEGHEEAVLQGAIETIRASRPALLVEIEERHHPGRSADLMGWIEAMGYAPYYHDGQELVPAIGRDFARWQPNHLRAEAFGSKNNRYINNFLFLNAH
ncbi:FkbM family methyltransferase [Methylobacterium sp. A54F]